MAGSRERRPEPAASVHEETAAPVDPTILIGSARQFWFTRRFRDTALESQFRKAKFKAGRPRITALIVLLGLVELQVLVSCVIFETPGLRACWFSVIAPSVLLWTMLAVLYSPVMNSSRLPVLAYFTAAAYEGFGLYGLFWSITSSDPPQNLAWNESHTRGTPPPVTEPHPHLRMP